MGIKELLPSNGENDGGKGVQIDLPTQDVLEEIVNRRRRRMLITLEEQSAQTPTDLSESIWGLEQSHDRVNATLHSVNMSVTQNHLPRFHQAELIATRDEKIHLTQRGRMVVKTVEWLNSVTAGRDYP